MLMHVMLKIEAVQHIMSLVIYMTQNRVFGVKYSKTSTKKSRKTHTATSKSAVARDTMKEFPTFFKYCSLQTATIVRMFPNNIPSTRSKATQTATIFVGVMISCLLATTTNGVYTVSLGMLAIILQGNFSVAV